MEKVLAGIVVRNVLQHIGIKAVEHHSVGKIVLFNQFHALFDTFVALFFIAGDVVFLNLQVQRHIGVCQ